MKNNTYIITICCLFLLCGKAFSQEWISIDGKPKGEAVTMKVIESSPSKYEVRISVNSLNVDSVKNENRWFHYLTFDKGCNLQNLGNPSLPCITQLIAIPSDAEVSASVYEEKWTDIEMGTIYPAQNPTENAERDFVMNENVYNSEFIPNIVTLGKEREWRGIRNVGVSICPFKYYPRENRLSVLSNFVLQVSFNNRKGAVLQEDSNQYGLFDNTVYRELNASESGTKQFTANDDNYNYLIITENTTNSNDLVFIESLKNFRIWKALKGYKTKVVNTSVTGTYSAFIKGYIANELSKGVKYVLFIGDSNNIPLSTVNSNNPSGQGGTVSGDYWYGCLNNSTEADIPIGRFSISSVSDFVNMVNKSIRYESSYQSSNTTLLVAHFEGAPSTISYQGYCNTIKNTYSNQMAFETAYGASVSDGGDDARNADVIDYINDGAHIVNYRGHAGDDFWGAGSWGTPNWNVAGECFESSQISNMDDTTNALFFCVACNAGNIASSTDCMLETFTRSNHGAVAFVGATMPTQTDANNYYHMYLYQKLLSDGDYHIGDMNLNAHIYNIQTYGIGSGNEYMAADNAFAYLCGGDPTLEIWTSTPQRISNVNVTSANGYLTVNTGLTGNYYISISSVNGERLDSIACSGSTCTFQIPADKFYFAVNKHNYFPYIVYFDRESDCVQNVTFTYDAYYEYTPLAVGYGVTPDISDGEVVVKNGHKLIIKNGTGGVLIESGFECEPGAVLQIK